MKRIKSEYTARRINFCRKTVGRFVKLLKDNNLTVFNKELTKIKKKNDSYNNYLKMNTKQLTKRSDVCFLTSLDGLYSQLKNIDKIPKVEHEFSSIINKMDDNRYYTELFFNLLFEKLIEDKYGSDVDYSCIESIKENDYGDVSVTVDFA